MERLRLPRVQDILQWHQPRWKKQLLAAWSQPEDILVGDNGEPLAHYLREKKELAARCREHPDQELVHRVKDFEHSVIVRSIDDYKELLTLAYALSFSHHPKAQRKQWVHDMWDHERRHGIPLLGHATAYAVYGVHFTQYSHYLQVHRPPHAFGIIAFTSWIGTITGADFLAMLVGDDIRDYSHADLEMLRVVSRRQ